jgi:uncharacterized membrane protein YgcG
MAERQTVQSIIDALAQQLPALVARAVAAAASMEVDLPAAQAPAAPAPGPAAMAAQDAIAIGNAPAAEAAGGSSSRTLGVPAGPQAFVAPVPPSQAHAAAREGEIVAVNANAGIRPVAGDANGGGATAIAAPDPVAAREASTSAHHPDAQINGSMNRSIVHVGVEPAPAVPVAPIAMSTDMASIFANALATAVSNGFAKVQPSVQFSLPPVPVWDGKAPGRRAHTFLMDIERLASMSSQAVIPMLQGHVGSDIREQIEQVSVQYASEGRELTWDDMKKEFLALTGELYERTAEQMRMAFVAGTIKQATGQTVAQYRAHFDASARTAACLSPELGATFFVAGLRPELRSRCQGDSMGRAFASVDAAYTYALKEERKQNDKPKVVAAITLPAPDQAPAQYQGHNGGRGGGGHGRGGGRGGGGRGGGRGGGQGYHHAPHAYAAPTGKRPAGGDGAPTPPKRPRTWVHNHETVCERCRGRGHMRHECPSREMAPPQP